MTTTSQAPGVGVTQDEHLEALSGYQYGWHDSDAAGSAAQRGLNEAVVRHISELKGEPEWMRDLRLKALRLFGKKPMPSWGAELDDIDFDNIKYFVRSTEGQAASWEELPEDIRTTYERLGIPEAERNSLVAGVAAQYESEVVYHQIRVDLESQGVIFVDAGKAWNESIDNSLKVAGGLGIRFKTAMGILRLDVAKGGGDGVKYMFGIGHSF